MKIDGIEYVGNGIDYIGAFLFSKTAVDPEAMIPAVSRDGLAEAPPPISGYRDANVAGMSCWNCGHFTMTGQDDDNGKVEGICNLFEAKAEGDCTCDRFTAHADLLRQQPHTSWAEDEDNRKRDDSERAMRNSIESYDYSESAVLNEIRFAGEANEGDGLVWKDILRTGKWSHTPTKKGVIKKALSIVKDGITDPEKGVISIGEIFANFNDRAVPYVTVPLSDDDEDHKNIARVNTGFVRKLKMVDRDGTTFLQAGIDFTEPEVKEKVLRGTIPDCSAGIPFSVTRRADNKFFNAVLDHVCLTRKPFIDRLSPFGIAAADSEDLPVEEWEEEPITPEPTQVPAEQMSLSFLEYQAALTNALHTQLLLSRSDYSVYDVKGNVAIIRHTSGTKWEVPFKVTEDSESPVRLAGVDNWKIIQEAPTQVEEPVAASNGTPTDLQNARELRELRLAQPNSQTGGIHMSVTPLSLDGVELSDEARTRIQGIITENDELRKKNRESEVDARIDALSNLGMKDRPGALKLYRQVMLSDDGGPAVVLFSDSDDDSKKERLTAIEILDRFIAGLTAADGDTVILSDQHLASDNDNKPANTPEGEKAPLDDRVKSAQAALYGKRSTRK